MKGHRVVVFYAHSLFAEGVAALLHRQGVDVVTVPALEGDVAKRLKALRPQVVILDSHDPCLSSELTVMGLLELSPRSRVIRLDLDRDRLEVYQKQRWAALKGQDLVKVIQGSVRSQDHNHELQAQRGKG
jgi:DNA-binding NarL/FixJ family response regulator